MARGKQPAAVSIPALPCACASLRRAARAVTQLYDSHLRQSGLSTPQFTLLQLLATAGPLTQGRLGRLLALDTTTLSRTLRPLDAKRWISRRAGEDRRERRIELTSAGRTHLQRAAPAWEAAQRRLRSQVGEDQWTRLLADLSMLAGVAKDAA